MFKPRPKQAEILEYESGKMGISAVPGSGKTATLSYLAAKLVATVPLDDDQEILIVTLVKSAVGNFASSMAKYLKDEFNLLPGLGYRVRTLHSLANDIVRERPSLVRLADDFTVIDERTADNILQEAVDAWVRANPNAPDHYLTPEHYSDNYTRNTRWVDSVKSMAMSFIKQAKDMQLSVDDVDQLLEKSKTNLPLADMCYEIYEQYERGLRYRGAVDFQDLIRLALKILTIDGDYLLRLRHRFPYILEDEAQDSSKLQEEILGKLAGNDGNWVRVGDPNQAIYETFTTANPQLLRNFIQREDVTAKTLPNSGRSMASIIDLANELIDWSIEHPNPEIREKKPLINRLFFQHRKATRRAIHLIIPTRFTYALRNTQRRKNETQLSTHYAVGCLKTRIKPVRYCSRLIAVVQRWFRNCAERICHMLRICALPVAHAQSSVLCRVSSIILVTPKIVVH